MPQDYILENLNGEFEFQHLIDGGSFTNAFHCHDHIEVFLSISGGENFIIDDKIYEMNPGDMFVNNQLEVHRTFARDGEKYERYVLSFKDYFLLPYCTAKTDLLHYVYRRPSDFSHKISLTGEQLSDFLFLAGQYKKASSPEYGSDVLGKLIFLEMLTLTARFYTKPAEQSTKSDMHRSMDIVSRLLQYISSNISSNLSLDALASEMGVSKFHLCKIFKENTGTTINAYITTRRIAETKYLLSTGVPVTDVCYLAGFNDLSHFIRTFHSIVGVSPGKYNNSIRSRGPSLYVGAESDKSP